MSEGVDRAWGFYIGDMIAFAGKVLEQADPRLPWHRRRYALEHRRFGRARPGGDVARTRRPIPMKRARSRIFSQEQYDIILV